MEVPTRRQGESMQAAVLGKAREAGGHGAVKLSDGLIALGFDPAKHQKELENVFNAHGLDKRMQPPEREAFVKKQLLLYSKQYNSRR